MSEGAKRIGDVARGTRELVFRLVKERGRKRGMENEGESGKGESEEDIRGG